MFGAVKQTPSQSEYLLVTLYAKSTLKLFWRIIPMSPLPLSAGGSASELASLGRTLGKGLTKIIFEEQMASLALPFIGSGKPGSFADTAPYFITQAFTFLRVPHAPQSLQVCP